MWALSLGKCSLIHSKHLLGGNFHISWQLFSQQFIPNLPQNSRRSLDNKRSQTRSEDERSSPRETLGVPNKTWDSRSNSATYNFSEQPMTSSGKLLRLNNIDKELNEVQLAIRRIPSPLWNSEILGKKKTIRKKTLSEQRCKNLMQDSMNIQDINVAILLTCISGIHRSECPGDDLCWLESVHK